MLESSPSRLEMISVDERQNIIYNTLFLRAWKTVAIRKMLLNSKRRLKCSRSSKKVIDFKADTMFMIKIRSIITMVVELNPAGGNQSVVD